ncbi:MAG: class I SAM-dependent methyltransferase [Actinobacteria bacterium]|nr:class I SAM-dependent methyltransferase [Actinomycetota bacterium]
MKDEILDKYTSELLYQLLLENKALERGREPSVEKLDTAAKRDLELLESELKRINEAFASKGASFWQATRNPIRKIYRRMLYVLFRPLVNSQVEDISAVSRALIHLKDYSKSYMDLRAKAFEVDFNRSFMNLTEIISKVFHPQIQKIYDQQMELIKTVSSMRDELDEARFAIVDIKRIPVAGAGYPQGGNAETGRTESSISSDMPGTDSTLSGIKDASNFYLAFENRFRGNREELLKKYSSYADYFERGQQIVDLGCGKGEFLEAMSNAGFDVFGVDANRDMVGECTRRGLRAVQGDVLAFLNEQSDGSIQSVYCGMLIEHLSPDEIIKLLSLLSRKLKRSARLVIETINPASLSVMTGSFVVDLSHRTLVHSKTLEFMLEYFGHKVIKTVFSSPIPADRRLKTYDPTQLAGETSEFIRTFNNNFIIIDSFLYSFQDYLTVSSKN